MLDESTKDAKMKNKIDKVSYLISKIADSYGVKAIYLPTNKVICEEVCPTYGQALRKARKVVKEKSLTTDVKWEPLPKKLEKGTLIHNFDVECEFCSDGDYKVESYKEIKAVKDKDDCHLTRINHTISNKNETTALLSVKEMLWNIICNCIRVGTAHHWLIKDFYDGIEDLNDRINGIVDFPQFTYNECAWEMFGNYTGTFISVKYYQTIQE